MIAAPVSEPVAAPPVERSARSLFIFLAAALFGLLWVYGPTLAELADRWGHQSQYSHGYLVPLFSLFLLWSRRQLLPSAEALRPSWWGLPVLGLALAWRFAGVYLYFDWLSA